MGWTLLIIVAAIVLFAITIYNRLVASRNRYKNAFAQIDVQLTRRHDLIPNLVETAKGYLKHERETLEAVINARNAAVSGLKAAAAELSFIVEWSDSLAGGSWSSAGVVETSPPLADDGTRETIRVTLPGEGDRRFVRLRVQAAAAGP